jgi:pimeloyl-ACP methyl ester carboxylesterase
MVRPVPRRLVILLLLLLPGFAATVPACGEAFPEPPTGAGRVSVSTSDGERLDAVELGRGDDLVVLSHGANGTKEGFYDLMVALADAGWRAVAYDARGVGDSTGRRGERRDEDLRAVVDHVRTSSNGTIVLVGASLGASLSLSMARELGAGVVVSLSAPASTFDALEAARALAVPVFVAASEDDEPFAGDAFAIAEAAGVDAVIVSGDRHGTGMFDEHPELIDRIVAFVEASRDP